jgi:hypothetical protein
MKVIEVIHAQSADAATIHVEVEDHVNILEANTWTGQDNLFHMVLVIEYITR